MARKTTTIPRETRNAITRVYPSARNIEAIHADDETHLGYIFAVCSSPSSQYGWADADNRVAAATEPYRNYAARVLSDHYNLQRKVAARRDATRQKTADAQTDARTATREALRQLTEAARTLDRAGIEIPPQLRTAVQAAQTAAITLANA